MIVAEYCKCPKCGNKKASKISWSGIVVCDKCGYNSTQNKKETKMSDKDSIESVFVKQFEADVHTAYQQMGTKLRNTVRSKSNVVGAATTFQKLDAAQPAQSRVTVLCQS